MVLISARYVEHRFEPQVRRSEATRRSLLRAWLRGGECSPKANVRYPSADNTSCFYAFQFTYNNFMTKITNFSDAHKVLAQFVPKATPGAYSLDRMQVLMDKLGNPQNSYKVIHVAGTSGKTSTSYYIASLLQQSCKKVGLTVSPHVDEVNERVQINLMPMPEEEFCKELSEFLNTLENTGVNPTYFELLVAFAYWEFARQGVDYAVVEVGLGGLLDGTNVVSRSDKVCVITDIGLDHTNVLGTNLSDIAAQKAGIVQEHNVTFMYRQPKEVMDAVKKRCQQKDAHLNAITQADFDGSESLPLFQQRNWYLAKKVFEYIAERDSLPELRKEQLLKSQQTYVPARMEVMQFGDKTVIMDGAHNPQKIRASVLSLQDKFPGQKMQVVLGLLGDKELEGVIKELKPIASAIYATYFAAEQDMPRQAINPDEIVKTAQAQGLKAMAIYEPEQAFQAALNEPESVLVIGSFFLLNHIRPLIFRS